MFTDTGNMIRKYKNPPVVEALCEFFFDNSKWDSTIPGLFYEKIKNNYPKKKELEQIGVQVSVLKDIHNFKTMRGEKRIQFVKEDGSQLVQIEKDLLVVNQFKPYPIFQDWKPVIDKMLNLYVEIAEPKGIKRIGVRYINQIVIPSLEFEIEEYFSIYPHVPHSLGAMHGKFMMRLEIPSKNEGHNLIVTFGSAPPSSPDSSVNMLDMYDVFIAPQLLHAPDVNKYIIEAQKNVETAFENIITDKTRLLFNEEEK